MAYEPDIEELLRLVDGGKPPPAKLAPTFTHKELIRKWANTFGFRPGLYPAGRTSEIYMHFLAWAKGELGYEPQSRFGGRLTRLKESQGASRIFRMVLTRLGFHSRSYHFKPERVSRREIAMDAPSAEFLRDWIRKNVMAGANPWAPVEAIEARRRRRK